MIKRISQEKEIEVAVINEVGALAKITSFLVNHGINIEAVAGYAAPIGEQAGLVFITDNNPAALHALMEHGYNDIKENQVMVIELENRPGALKNISEILAQNSINITYIYATACSGGCPTKIVLSTSNNRKAFSVLSE
ncbi:MAG: hypothetical protein PHO42_04310 [Candidatus Omnitrophica bacterium]|nr:hypothetical protein [Candidatus Omnitrophota bacterium]